MSSADPFEELEAMVEGLDLAGHLRSVKLMSNQDLVRRYLRVKEELKELGELAEAHTDNGRNLHTEHTALLDELHERKLR